MTHKQREPVDIFGDGDDEDPVVVERAAPAYEGTTHSTDEGPEAIELDATKSAYANLPDQLRSFVDGLANNEDPITLVRHLGLAPSLAGVLLRRPDIQDALSLSQNTVFLLNLFQLIDRAGGILVLPGLF